MKSVQVNRMISVIIPVYNTAPYLARCINSIRAQTYTNLEIILINDGSADDSGHICDEYALLDKRINVIHKENGGLASARNVGLVAAKGDWIGFVDSDDWILPEMYERLLSVAKESGANMSMCGFSFINEQGDVLKSCAVEKDIVYTKMEAFHNLGSGKGVFHTVIWDKLYKASIFDGLLFPEGRIHEDEYMAHRFIDKCDVIAASGSIMYMYVQRRESIMNQIYSVKRLEDSWFALYDRYEFFKKKKMRKHARLTVQVLGGVIRIGMENLKRADYYPVVFPMYKRILWLLVFSLDLRAIKLFLAWCKWR